MNLVLLPGNSPKNKEWIEWVAEQLKDRYARRIIQYYDHWKTGGQFNFGAEMEKLTKTVNELSYYEVFAKSIGVLFALKAINAGALTPKRCIFVGSAIGFSTRLGFPVEKWLKELSAKKIPTVFIQQTNDPAIAADELASLLERVGFAGYELIKTPGDDHVYEKLRLEPI